MSGSVATNNDPRIGTITASKWCAVNAGGTAIDCTQNAPAASAGADTQVVFNDGGSTLAGATNMVWNKTTSLLDVTGQVSTNSLKLKTVSGAAAPISGSSFWSSDGTNVWRATGSIGIGTTSPTAALSIEKPFPIQSQLLLHYPTGSWASAAWGSNFRFISTTMVGDGHAEQKTFGVNGFGVGIGFDPPVYASPNALLIDGNVGIGTSAPGYLLDVNGTANATAFRSAAGQTFKVLSGTTNIAITCAGPAGCQTQAVSFGYTFTSAPKVVVTGATWGSWCNIIIPTAYGTSTTGFTLGTTNPAAGNPSGATCSFNWIAIGN